MLRQILGFDIMLDRSGTAWLLEVNSHPSLTCDFPVDEVVKSSVVRDALSMLRRDIRHVDRVIEEAAAADAGVESEGDGKEEGDEEEEEEEEASSEREVSESAMDESDYEGFERVCTRFAEKEPLLASLTDRRVINAFVRHCGRAHRLRGMGMTGWRALLRELGGGRISSVDADLAFVRAARGQGERVLSVGAVMELLAKLGV